jgi:hypothetical protein
VTLAWDVVKPDQSDGTYVYYETSEGDSSRIDLPNVDGEPVSEFSMNISENVTYAFHVTAYKQVPGGEWLESRPSNTVEVQALRMREDDSFQIKLAAISGSPNWSTLSLITPVQNGHLKAPLKRRTLVYTPDPDYSGTDSFTYSLDTGQPDLTVGTVGIKIDSVNDPPVASPVTTTAVLGETITIPLIGTDVDGDPVNWSSLAPDSNRFSDYSATHVLYTALGEGQDEYTLTVSDGLGGTDEATVTINVLTEPPSLTPSVERSTDGDILLSWDVLPGRYYRVLYAEDLNALQWSVVAEHLYSLNSTLDWMATEPARGRGFFRVEPTPEAVASSLVN